MTHILVLPGEPSVSLLSPASTPAVSRDPIGGSVTYSCYSVVLYVHATPVPVHTTAVRVKLAVESHAKRNRSVVQSSCESTVTPHSENTGYLERESVWLSPRSVAAACVLVLEGVVGGGCQMVSGPH